ncbi:MAG: MarR family transcriptional regulator [Roseitalea sp.]|jgi:DNA-binding MarR family transcriptional regulator|nr:MarR family transcriptional regulator [Roseitalea sp.]MBO6722620.1 MarR family transcriptional regulator [Roseitalea sp.]MBO6745091.1 MarR family transcriptional regulator [Roseitalea sp.]
MEHDSISRYRRFSRAVTRQVGALDQSFLGRGRPLGSARVLNAIGQGRCDIADIRAYLGLDSGLTSRLLRGLEDEGLIETRTHPDDGRRRVAELTPAGRAEFDAYEELSDTAADRFLSAHPDPDAILAAMDFIATAMNRHAVTIDRVDPTSTAARYCLARYYDELARRFEEGFDVALSCDPDASDMVPPRGAFLVALSDGLPVGCVGLKGNGGKLGEVKRLWVAPDARGTGLGKRLMAAIEDEARALSMDTLRLDTNRALPEAYELYNRNGWTEIDRFNDDPYPDFFFEKRLV